MKTLVAVQIALTGAMAAATPAYEWAPHKTVITAVAVLGAITGALLDPRTTREAMARAIAGVVIGTFVGAVILENGGKGSTVNLVAFAVAVIGGQLAKELVNRSARLSRWALDQVEEKLPGDKKPE